MMMRRAVLIRSGAAGLALLGALVLPGSAAAATPTKAQMVGQRMVVAFSGTTAKAPLLARIPFDPALREASDAGRPVLEAAPDAEISHALRDLADAVVARRAGAIRKPLTVL